MHFFTNYFTNNELSTFSTKVSILCLLLQVYCTLFAAAFAGVIHDYEHHEEPHHIEETDHHHKVEHEHATSHQSFKIHHFHPVPVYVKKEDQHLLKHPVEISGVKHKLKVRPYIIFLTA